MVLVSNETKVDSPYNISSKVKEGCRRHERAIVVTAVCCLVLMALVAVGLIVAATVVSMPSLLTAGLFLLAIAFTGMAILAIKLASKIEPKIEEKQPLKRVSFKPLVIPVETSTSLGSGFIDEVD